MMGSCALTVQHRVFTRMEKLTQHGTPYTVVGQFPTNKAGFSSHSRHEFPDGVNPHGTGFEPPTVLSRSIRVDSQIEWTIWLPHRLWPFLLKQLLGRQWAPLRV